MTSFRLPAIQNVPSLSKAERAAILDSLFEPSPSLHLLCEPILRDNVYSNYAQLVNAIQQELVKLAKSKSESDRQSLTDILSSHPRLGEKKIESAQSQAEQAQLSTTEPAETERLSQMNALYEETFPGLKYVVFVNGRSRSLILQDMQMRIDRADFDTEQDQAIAAMCDIANDRAGKLVG